LSGGEGLLVISHNAETGIASILSSKRSVFEPVYKTTPRTNLLPASLKEFHKALKINRNNPTTRQNIFLTIKALGRDPNSFGDRVQLGDGANNSADFVISWMQYWSTRLRCRSKTTLV
jgi:hypothetical protein